MTKAKTTAKPKTKSAEKVKSAERAMIDNLERVLYDERFKGDKLRSEVERLNGVVTTLSKHNEALEVSVRQLAHRVVNPPIIAQSGQSFVPGRFAYSFQVYEEVKKPKTKWYHIWRKK